MTPTPSAAALAAELQELHNALRSWRKVQRLHYPAVNFATLNRVARSGGEWLPKDRRILIALGLVKAKPELTEHENRIMKARNKMVRATRKAVLKR